MDHALIEPNGINANFTIYRGGHHVAVCSKRIS